jgi:hypothetical protein
METRTFCMYKVQIHLAAGDEPIAIKCVLRVAENGMGTKIDEGRRAEIY